MKFETVRIYFLREFSVCCHPKLLLPWQRDLTTSPLYYSGFAVYRCQSPSEGIVAISCLDYPPHPWLISFSIHWEIEPCNTDRLGDRMYLYCSKYRHQRSSLVKWPSGLGIRLVACTPAPGSTAEISGLQGSRDPPFGTLFSSWLSHNFTESTKAMGTLRYCSVFIVTVVTNNQWNHL